MQKVLIVPEPMLRHFYHRLARRLKTRHGCEVHIAHANKLVAKWYRDLPDAESIFASISEAVNLNSALTDPLHPSQRSQLLADARAVEEATGRTLNSFSVGNRHLGRGYVMGSTFHPRSRFTDLTDYDHLIHGFVAYIQSWQKILDETGATLVIGGPPELVALARQRGLNYRNPVPGRFENWFYWASNEFNECEWLEHRYEHMRSQQFEPVDIERPYQTAAKDWNSYLGRRSPLVLLRRIARQTALHVYWRLHRTDRAKFGGYWSSEIWFMIREWAALRRLTSERYPSLESLPKGPFVYFPLAMEPETTISRLSPEYLSQHNAIVTLARSVPAGVRVIVKETLYCAGRRPNDFYRHIAELKNVEFVNAQEDGLKIVRAADVVATITGTAGLEAAAMGKPVVLFGLHNLQKMLPHVHTVRDDNELVGFLGNIFGGKFDQKTARGDGARFYRSLEAISFDAGAWTTTDIEKISDDMVDAATELLFNDLSRGVRATA